MLPVLLVLLLCSHREVWCCSCVAIEKYGVACVVILDHSLVVLLPALFEFV